MYKLFYVFATQLQLIWQSFAACSAVNCVICVQFISSSLGVTTCINQDIYLHIPPEHFIIAGLR